MGNHLLIFRTSFLIFWLILFHNLFFGRKFIFKSMQYSFKFSLVPWVISIASTVIFFKSIFLVHSAGFSQTDLESVWLFLFFMNEELGWGSWVAVVSFLCDCAYLCPPSLWRPAVGLDKWVKSVRKQAFQECGDGTNKLRSSQFHNVFELRMYLPVPDQVPKVITCFQ